ncbi:MAG: (Fe-S)-binding protein [Propionibacteriaceae bacterium]|jgi:L-lactate dehydrogenase complex protein LldE|nr:(Fe-S)-binding protein [Propionibacteriaceae bacterium]
MDRPGEGLRVALFATCINDVMFPDTCKATVKVLERLGCEVDFPMAQTCCGQMFTNTGYYKEGLATVKTYLEAFEGYDYVVAPSASCVGSVRHQHPMLARWAKDVELEKRAEAIAAKSFDLTEFIVNVLHTTDVGAFFPHKVTYHTTCHSIRVEKVGDAPFQLLAKVKGMTFVPLPNDEFGLNTANECCGFGGTFSLKNPDVSVAMATEKVRNILDTEVEYVVAGDNSCLMNIGGILRRGKAPIKPLHIAELLAQTEEEAK